MPSARCKAYAQRPVLDIAGFGEEPRAFLLAGGWLPGDLLPAWSSVIDQALQGVRRCFARAGAVASLRLHGDCHAGNVLWTDEGPHFVDFDDSRMGPAVQDLWMLLSGDRVTMGAQLADVLAGLRGFPRIRYARTASRRSPAHAAPDPSRRLAGAALGRSGFPAAFPWFGTQHYWQDRILELREQIA
jgi:Ser/Thr protein kinase RdoA (MazF antagonist)